MIFDLCVALAKAPRPTFDELPEVLTIKQILEYQVLPLSKSTLERIAKDGADDSPFYMRGGRWLATKTDLLAWVRSAPRASDDPGDPMPPTCTSAADVLAAIEARSAER